MDTKTFGSALRSYRLEHNLSQQELANILGTTKQVLSRYEKGDRDPKISTAVEYSAKLNIPLELFLDQKFSTSQVVAGFSPHHLKECRIKQGMSIYQASDACDINDVLYSQIESGSIIPTIEQIQQLALGLHTSMDFLCQMSFSVSSDAETVTIDSDGLDELDMKFLQMIKQLSDQEKQMLVAQMEGLLRSRGQ